MPEPSNSDRRQQLIQRAGTVAALAVAFSTAIAFPVVSYFALRWLYSNATQINASVGAAIIAGLAACIAAIINQRLTRKKDVEEKHRSQKIDVYNTFFDIVDEIFSHESQKLSSEELAHKLGDRFKKLSRGLIVWGSPQVIRAWHKFKDGSDRPPIETLYAADELMKTIRVDLGNNNKDLLRGDLIALYLKSRDELSKSALPQLSKPVD